MQLAICLGEDTPEKSQNTPVASIYATDLGLKDTSKQNEELEKNMTNAIALAIQGYKDMNNTRRQAKKSELNKGHADNYNYKLKKG